VYTVITDEKEIKTCQERFINILSTNTIAIRCRPAFPSGSKETDAMWSGRLGFWAAFAITGIAKNRPRYWNVFGFERPEPNQLIPLIAEINFPCNRLDRNVQGVLGKNEEGKIAVLHRGRFGGNHPVTSEEFFSRTQFHVIEVKDYDRKTKMALIGELESSDFQIRVRDFIREVGGIKGTVN
jgi:hypothetical protein